MTRLLIPLAAAGLLGLTLVLPATAQAQVEFGYKDRIFKLKYYLPESMDLVQSRLVDLATTLNGWSGAAASPRTIEEIGGMCLETFIEAVKPTPSPSPLEAKIDDLLRQRAEVSQGQTTGVPSFAPLAIPATSCEQQVRLFAQAFEDSLSTDDQLAGLAKETRRRFSDQWMKTSDLRDAGMRLAADRLAEIVARSTRLMRAGVDAPADVRTLLQNGLTRRLLTSLAAQQPFEAINANLTALENATATTLSVMVGDAIREREEMQRLAAANKAMLSRANQQLSALMSVELARAKLKAAERQLIDMRSRTARQLSPFGAWVPSVPNAVPPSAVNSAAEYVKVARAELASATAAARAIAPAPDPRFTQNPTLVAQLRPRDAEFKAFENRFIRCWSANGQVDPGISATVQVYLNKDGTLVHAPMLIGGDTGPRNDVDGLFKVASKAITALIECQPYAVFNPDGYEAWKTFAIPFGALGATEAATPSPATSSVGTCEIDQTCRVVEKTVFCKSFNDLKAVLEKPVGAERRKLLTTLKARGSCSLLEVDTSLTTSGSSRQVTPADEPPVELVLGSLAGGERGFVLKSALASLSPPPEEEGSKQPPAQTRKTDAQPSPTEAIPPQNAAIPSAANAGIPTSEQEAFRDKVKQCWKMPHVKDNTMYAYVVLRLNPDGTLIGSPLLSDRYQQTADKRGFKAFVESAFQALVECQPYTMFSPDNYGSWKELEPRFFPGMLKRG